MIFASLRFMGARHLLALLCLGHIGWTQAEIYKSVDAEGHVTYSSTPSRGAKKLGLESLSSPTFLPPPSPHRARTYDSSTSPSDFPRVDSNTQKNRDGRRRKILGDELNAEEKLLTEARINLQQEKTARNIGKTSSLQEEVTLHEKNISALKTELSNIK